MLNSYAADRPYSMQPHSATATLDSLAINALCNSTLFNAPNKLTSHLQSVAQTSLSKVGNPHSDMACTSHSDKVDTPTPLTITTTVQDNSLTPCSAVSPCSAATPCSTATPSSSQPLCPYTATTRLDIVRLAEQQMGAPILQISHLYIPAPNLTSYAASNHQTQKQSVKHQTSPIQPVLNQVKLNHDVPNQGMLNQDVQLLPTNILSAHQPSAAPHTHSEITQSAANQTQQAQSALIQLYQVYQEGNQGKQCALIQHHKARDQRTLIQTTQTPPYQTPITPAPTQIAHIQTHKTSMQAHMVAQQSALSQPVQAYMTPQKAALLGTSQEHQNFQNATNLSTQKSGTKLTAAPHSLNSNAKSQLVYITLRSNLNHKGLSLTRVQLLQSVNESHPHEPQPIAAHSTDLENSTVVDTSVEVVTSALVSAKPSVNADPDSLNSEPQSDSKADLDVILKRQPQSYSAQQMAEYRYQHAYQEQLKANCCLTNIDCIEDEYLDAPEYLTSEISDSPLSEPPLEDHDTHDAYNAYDDHDAHDAYDALEWEWNEDAVIDLIYSQDNETDYVPVDSVEDQLEDGSCFTSDSKGYIESENEDYIESEHELCIASKNNACPTSTIKSEITAHTELNLDKTYQPEATADTLLLDTAVKSVNTVNQNTTVQTTPINSAFYHQVAIPSNRLLPLFKVASAILYTSRLYLKLLTTNAFQLNERTLQPSVVPTLHTTPVPALTYQPLTYKSLTHQLSAHQPLTCLSSAHQSLANQFLNCKSLICHALTHHSQAQTTTQSTNDSVNPASSCSVHQTKSAHATSHAPALLNSLSIQSSSGQLSQAPISTPDLVLTPVSTAAHSLHKENDYDSLSCSTVPKFNRPTPVTQPSETTYSSFAETQTAPATNRTTSQNGHAVSYSSSHAMASTSSQLISQPQWAEFVPVICHGSYVVCFVPTSSTTSLHALLQVPWLLIHNAGYKQAAYGQARHEQFGYKQAEYKQAVIHQHSCVDEPQSLRSSYTNTTQGTLQNNAQNNFPKAFKTPNSNPVLKPLCKANLSGFYGVSELPVPYPVFSLHTLFAASAHLTLASSCNTVPMPHFTSAHTLMANPISAALLAAPTASSTASSSAEPSTELNSSNPNLLLDLATLNMQAPACAQTYAHDQAHTTNQVPSAISNSSSTHHLSSNTSYFDNPYLTTELTVPLSTTKPSVYLNSSEHNASLNSTKSCVSLNTTEPSVSLNSNEPSIPLNVANDAHQEYVKGVLQPQPPLNRNSRGFTVNRVFDFLVNSTPSQKTELSIQPVALASKLLTTPSILSTDTPKTATPAKDNQASDQTATQSLNSLPTPTSNNGCYRTASQELAPTLDSPAIQSIAKRNALPPTATFNHALSSCRYHAAVTDAEQYSPDFCSCSASNLEPPLPLNTTENAELHFDPVANQPKTVAATCSNYPADTLNSQQRNSFLPKQTRDIQAHEITARDIKAHEIKTCDIKTHEVIAKDEQEKSTENTEKTELGKNAALSNQAEQTKNIQQITQTDKAELALPTNVTPSYPRTSKNNADNQSFAHSRDTAFQKVMTNDACRTQSAKTKHRYTHALATQLVVLDLHTWAASTKSHTLCLLQAPENSQDQWQPAIKNALRQKGQLIISSHGANFTPEFIAEPIPISPTSKTRTLPPKKPLLSPVTILEDTQKKALSKLNHHAASNLDEPASSNRFNNPSLASTLVNSSISSNQEFFADGAARDNQVPLSIQLPTQLPTQLSIQLNPFTPSTLVTSASSLHSSNLAVVPSKPSTTMTNLTQPWNLFKRSTSQASPLQGMHRQNLVLRALRHQLLYMCLSLGGLGIGLLSLGALIYKSNQSNLIPYVVTVDSHGVVLNQGQAVSQAQIPKTVVTSQLCNFVRNLRMLSQDREVQQQAILNAYAFVRPDSELIKQMNEYYSSHNPFQTAEQAQVSIDIANAIEMGPHTFQIDWVENTAHQEPKRMRAMISYSVQPVLKTDADSLLRNPLGLYVENFVFSQILS